MSQFGAEKFTTRSREVIEAAQLAATTGGNTHTEPIHLLVALLRQEDGTSPQPGQKAGVDAGHLLAQAEGDAAAAAPRDRRDRPAAQRLRGADPRAGAARSTSPASMKDDYVATEHLLVAIATVESPAQKVLTDAGLTAAGLREAHHGRPRQPARDQPGRGVDVRERWRSTPSTSPRPPRTAGSTRSSAATPRSGA